MLYAAPESRRRQDRLQAKYDNFIGGKWTPRSRAGFDVITPITGGLYPGRPVHRRGRRTGPGRRPRRFRQAWARTSPSSARILLKIADRMEQNLETLAYAETVDNGKPIRETLNADASPGRRPFPLLRRLPAFGRLGLRNRRTHVAYPLPRAAGRRRPDHPLELPAADGRLEAARPWPPATAWCSSRPNRPRFPS